MQRDRSPIERVVAYATFFSISIAIHLVVILGDRGRWPLALPSGPTPAAPAGAPATAETAPIGTAERTL